MRLALTLAVLLAVSALAANIPIFIDPFEFRSGTGDTQDDMLLFQIANSTGDDPDVRTAGQEDCVGNNNPHPGCSAGTAVGNIQHDERNGTGHYSSQGALLIDVATGEQAYYAHAYNAKCLGAGTCSPPVGAPAGSTAANCECCTGAGTGNCIGDLVPLNEQVITAHFSFRTVTLPGSNRGFFEFTEGDSNSSAGCKIAQTSTGAFSLSYGSTSLSATSSTIYGRTLACEADKYAPCTAGTQATDCPASNQTCGSNCSGSDPSDCYWAPIEFTQTVGEGFVKCTARVRGVIVAEAETSKPPPITNVVDYKIGAVDGPSTSFRAWIDDFVLCRGARCGYGVTPLFVPARGAATTGVTQTWQTSSGTDHGALVNDYGDPKDQYVANSSSQVTGKSENRAEQFWDLVQNTAECSVDADCNTAGGGVCAGSPLACPNAITAPAIDADSELDGIEAVAIGNTDVDAGNRSADVYTMLCPTSASCGVPTPKRDFVVSANTRDHAYGVGLWVSSPAGSSWSSGSNLSDIGVGVDLNDFYTSSTLTLQPDATAGKDVHLASTEPTTNHATTTPSIVGVQVFRVARGIISFDLSTIPAGSTILSATLTLNVEGISAPPLPGVQIRRILRTDWDEATVTWNIYKTASNWTSAGASDTTSDVTITDQVSVASPTVVGAYVVSAPELRTQAQTALDSVSGQLMHMLIKQTTEGSSQSWSYSTSDSGTAANRPKLVLTYTTPATAFELRLQGVGVAGWAERRQSVPQNLKDHNIGAKTCSSNGDCGGCAGALCENTKCVKNCTIDVVAIGDSMNGSTNAQPCSGGALLGGGPSQRCDSGALCTTTADCTAGEECKGRCSGKSYCSYDLLNASQPPGGCNLDDSICRVCSGRLAENSGQGWKCGVDGDCPASGGTCNTGTGYCQNAGDSADIGVECCTGGVCTAGNCVGGTYDGQTCAASCEGLGGTCYSTATCLLSCPGGRCSASPSHKCSTNTDCRPPTCPTCGTTETCKSGCSLSDQTCVVNADCPGSETCYTSGQCPTSRTAWGQYVATDLNVNSLAVCAQDGITSRGYATFRFDGDLKGESGICTMAIGTGQCVCTSGAQCGGGTCDTTNWALGRCTTDGDGHYASCTSKDDCAGRICAPPPPDYMTENLIANDSWRAVGSQPLCPQCAGWCAVQSGSPCDWAINAKARQRAADVGNVNAFCYDDATCTSQFGSWSQCAGLNRGYTNFPSAPAARFSCLTTGSTCTMRGPTGCTFACILGGITGLGTCRNPSAQQTTIISSSTGFGLNGICSSRKYCSGASNTPCTGDGDCTGFGTCTTPDCGSGYTWANNLCFKTCTVDKDCSTKACTTSADCTSPGEICESSFCVLDGMCDGTKCAGRCTIPSSAYPCNGDEDCRGPRFDWNIYAGLGYGALVPEPLNMDGVCDTASGTCRCTGIQDCADPTILPAEQQCPQMVAQTYASWVPTGTVKWLKDMKRRIDVAKSPTTGVKPVLVFGTMPYPTSNMCSLGQQNDGAYKQINGQIMATLSPVADCGLRIDQLVKTPGATPGEVDRGHSDVVHLDQVGAEACGLAYRDVLRTLNSCIKSSGTVQGYCLLPTGSYATCSTDPNCNGLQAGDCDGSLCICDASTQCPGGECQIKVCTSGSDCPASTDTCNVEP